ncbi:MAG TPA: FMN-binding protein, partial [Spirochaetales bacterium]|nr:FMN-binding protein [Spirochaetales bacterium]
MSKRRVAPLALLAVAMLAVIGGCATGTARNGEAPVSGTYEGTGYGMQGPIKVQVTVDGGKIAAVKILSSKETPNVVKVAFERLPA